MTLLFVLGRIIFGGYFFLQGYNHFENLKFLTVYANSKKVPFPEIAVIIGGILLAIGGICIVFGVMPRTGLSCIVLFLLPTTYLMHDFWNEVDLKKREIEKEKFIRNILYLSASLMLAMIPIPWAFSLGG